jgi:peptidyl-dipeptidase Dcp
MATDRPSDSEGENPFFDASDLPLGMPAFDRIRNEHFSPAFERGMAEELAEVERIARSNEPPTFENTLVALERSGRLLRRSRTVFNNLTSAHTNDTLEALRTEFAPRFSAHADRIRLDPDLFARIESIHARIDELGLAGEDRRLVERYRTDFVRAGAMLSKPDKERLRALNSEIAELGAEFTQNVLDEVNDAAVVVDSIEQLKGLSEQEIAAAAQAAEERGLPGHYVLPLLNTSGQPVLAKLEDRGLRRRVHKASLSRGMRGGEYDNREVVSRVMRLRAERARLLGYANHAEWVLEDETALTPGAVNELLTSLVGPAVRNAEREAERLQRMIDADGGAFELAPWDWAYYSEKLRRADYDYDEEQLRPYFELDAVIQRGVFFAATRLYGITFQERTDLPTYHPDVRVFEVHDGDGELLAIFLGDYYARPTKRGGALVGREARGRQPHQHPQARRGRSHAADVRRSGDGLPRVRPRPARDVLRRRISALLGHRRPARLRRVSLAGERDVGDLAGGRRELRCPSRDR